MEGRFLLDVVVREGSAIFQLLSGENKPLLVRRNTFLILNFSPRGWMSKLVTRKNNLLDVVNGITLLDIQGDGLACQSLHEDLHYCVSELIL